MSVDALAQTFGVPLLMGQTPRIGLPLSETEPSTAAEALEPAMDTVWRQGRAIWARLPRPQAETGDLLTLAILHDVLVALHPIAVLATNAVAQ